MLSILVMHAVSWCWGVYPALLCDSSPAAFLEVLHFALFVLTTSMYFLSPGALPVLSSVLSCICTFSVFSFHFSSPWARFYKLFSIVLCCQVEKNRLPVSLCLKGLGTKTLFLVPSFLLFLDCYSGFLSPFSLTSFQDPWWRGRWIKRQVSLQTLILIIFDNIW